MYFFFRATDVYARLQGGAGQLGIADITFFEADDAQSALHNATAGDVLLMDLAHGLSHIPGVSHIRQYAAASPYSLQGSFFKVWEKAHKLAKRYYPTSSLDECKAMRRLLYPTDAERKADAASDNVHHHGRALLPNELMLIGMDQQDLLARFNKFGGLPRHVFLDTWSELYDNLQTALRETNLDDIVNMVDTQKGFTNLSKLSSMILHYNVFVSPPLTKSLRQQVSQAVDAAICAKHDHQPIPEWPVGVPTQLPFNLLPDAVRIPTNWLKEYIYDFYTDHSTDESV